MKSLFHHLTTFLHFDLKDFEKSGKNAPPYCATHIIGLQHPPLLLLANPKILLESLLDCVVSYENNKK